jgi:hypothetical protein
MTTLIDQSDRRRSMAEEILSELQLVQLWSQFGRPVIVGALAYDLMFDYDIDMEIYCPDLKIGHGFQVLADCALNPHVRQAAFLNALETPDKALYWKLQYLDRHGNEWKIDMWSAPEDYPLPRAENLIAPMQRALDRESRAAILALKQARKADSSLKCLSIDIYRAVIDDGVRTPEQLRTWLEQHETGVLTDWKPRIVPC